MVFSREMLLDLNTKSMVISLIDISISWIFPQIYLWKMSAEFDDTSFLFSHERMNLFGVFYETNTLKFPYNTMRISLLVFFSGEEIEPRLMHTIISVFSINRIQCVFVSFFQRMR